jgi:hypothetical protein
MWIPHSLGHVADGRYAAYVMALLVISIIMPAAPNRIRTSQTVRQHVRGLQTNCLRIAVSVCHIVSASTYVEVFSGGTPLQLRCISATVHDSHTRNALNSVHMGLAWQFNPAPSSAEAEELGATAPHFSDKGLAPPLFGNYTCSPLSICLPRVCQHRPIFKYQKQTNTIRPNRYRY